MIIDVSGAIGDTASLVLSLLLGYYAWKIGKYSEFVRFWKWVAVGWTFVAVGRAILAYYQFTHLTIFGDELTVADVGRSFVITGTAVMVVGFRYLALTLRRLFKEKEAK